jgi:hypothetical protein
MDQLGDAQTFVLSGKQLVTVPVKPSVPPEQKPIKYGTKALNHLPRGMSIISLQSIGTGFFKARGDGTKARFIYTGLLQKGPASAGKQVTFWFKREKIMTYDNKVKRVYMPKLLNNPSDVNAYTEKYKAVKARTAAQTARLRESAPKRKAEARTKIGYIQFLANTELSFAIRGSNDPARENIRYGDGATMHVTIPKNSKMGIYNFTSGRSVYVSCNSIPDGYAYVNRKVKNNQGQQVDNWVPVRRARVKVLMNKIDVKSGNTAVFYMPPNSTKTEQTDWGTFINLGDASIGMRQPKQ